MSPIPEPQALAVNTLSQDWQGRSMYMFSPYPLLNKVIQKLHTTWNSEIILIAPCGHHNRGSHAYSDCVCVDHPRFFPYRRDPYCHNRDSSRRKVIPSARMEALMQHYQAAGFSEEVSRLALPPSRPSTNRMYYDMLLRFTHWAAGQGIDLLGPTASQTASLSISFSDTHDLSPQTVKATGPA